MPDWEIRPADLQDLEVLVDFNCRLARETEGRELPRDVVSRGVARGLERSPEVQYFVAASDQSPLGVLMLTREWSDWRDGWLAWLQSVYVAPPHRGQGVFRSLLNHVLECLKNDADVVGVRLYVENANQQAQQVYRRAGFCDPHYKVLERLL